MTDVLNLPHTSPVCKDTPCSNAIEVNEAMKCLSSALCFRGESGYLKKKNT